MVGIRCPEDRPHGLYENCGRLMAVIEDGKIYLHCPMCKTFHELTIGINDNHILKSVNKSKRFKLEKRLTLVEK